MPGYRRLGSRSDDEDLKRRTPPHTFSNPLSRGSSSIENSTASYSGKFVQNFSQITEHHEETEEEKAYSDYGGRSRRDDDVETQALLGSLTEAVRKIVPSRQVSIVTPSRRASMTPAGTHHSSNPLGVRGDQVYSVAPSPLNAETGVMNVRRPVYSQRMFQRIYHETVFGDEILPQISWKQRFQSWRNRPCRDVVSKMFPMVDVVQEYDVKHHLLLDVISGLSTGCLRIPQSMAYALLAQLPPAYGLYTAFFSALLYCIFGTSHHLAAGAQGVVSLMVGTGVERILLHHSGTAANISGGSFDGDDDNPANLDTIVGIMCTLTFLVGVIQASMGILQLGFITNYLSDPLIGGFITGAACHVVVSQLPSMFGVSVVKSSDAFNLITALIDLGKLIVAGKANGATAAISFVTFISLVGLKTLNSWMNRHWKVPLPCELVVITFAILFSYLSDAKTRFGVKVVGPVPSGFAAPRLPNPDIVWEAMVDAVPTAIVSFAIGYSVAKAIALRQDYEINGNQEAFAFGFVNTVGSFFGCFVTTAAMSASCMHESLGGQTQVGHVVASLLVLLTIFFIGLVFEPAPICVLSVIILVNLKTILSQFGDLKPLWVLSKIDFLQWVITYCSVMLLDVDVGLAVGVAFSLLTVVFRTQWPHTCILGRIPSTDIYKNKAVTPNAHEIPGIIIFRFEGGLYFASAEHFRNCLYSESQCNPVTIRMRQVAYAKKLDLLKQSLERAKQSLMKSSEKARLAARSGRRESIHKRQRSNTARFLARRYFEVEENESDDETVNMVHHVILDFSTCGFIDSVGIRTLTQVITGYSEVQIKVYLANVRAAVRSMLLQPKSGQGEETIVNASHIFLSVHDAVLAALEDAQRTEERNFIIADAATQSALRVSRIASDDETEASNN